ncbi:MAG TPA: membrane protein insertion efficiency factor YidD [Deltaproteobacteria bacterium]|nr:membrane protein insertion efficiency factor YidD [Deltaproteobacteria bacterium]
MLFLCCSLALAAGPHPPRQTVLHSTARVLFAVWSGLLTRADGNRCSFEPSCSAYAAAALRASGPAGLALATDRLMREASAPTYPASETRALYLDPLSAHPPPSRLLSGGWCRAQRRRGAQLCL